MFSYNHYCLLLVGNQELVVLRAQTKMIPQCTSSRDASSSSSSSNSRVVVVVVVGVVVVVEYK